MPKEGEGRGVVCGVGVVKRGPGFGKEGGEREVGVLEEGGKDEDPAASEDADEAEPGGPAGAAGEEVGAIEVGEEGRGVVGVVSAADADKPEGGDGDGEPKASGTIRVDHAGALPLPAAAFGHLEAMLNRPSILHP